MKINNPDSFRRDDCVRRIRRFTALATMIALACAGAAPASAPAPVCDVLWRSVPGVSSNASVGGSVVISGSLYNAGPGTAAATEAKAQVKTPGGVLIASATVSVPSIPAGGSYTVSITVPLPASAGSGTFVALLVADNRSQLSQSSTSNDYSAGTNFTVSPPPAPPLSLALNSSPSNTTAGASSSFKVTASSAATAWRAELSTDNGSTFATISTQSGSATTWTVNFTSTKSTTAARVRVSATDTAGKSVSVVTSSFSVAAASPAAIKPAITTVPTAAPGAALSVTATVVDAFGNACPNVPVVLEDPLLRMSRPLGATSAAGAITAAWTGANTAAAGPGLYGTVLHAGSAKVMVLLSVQVSGLRFTPLSGLSTPIAANVTAGSTPAFITRAPGSLLGIPIPAEMRALAATILAQQSAALSDVAKDLANSPLTPITAFAIQACGVTLIAGGPADPAAYPVCGAAVTLVGVQVASVVPSLIVAEIKQMIDYYVADPATRARMKAVVSTTALAVSIASIKPDGGFGTAAELVDTRYQAKEVSAELATLANGQDEVRVCFLNEASGKRYSVVVRARAGAAASSSGGSTTVGQGSSSGSGSSNTGSSNSGSSSSGSSSTSSGTNTMATPASSATTTTIVKAGITSFRSLATLSGTNTLGYAIEGNVARTVIIRVVGPGLAAYKMTGGVAKPYLKVYSSAGALVGEGGPGTSGSPMVTAALNKAGGFPTGDKDAAVVLSLPPGSVTIQAWSADGVIGTALVDVMLVP